MSKQITITHERTDDIPVIIAFLLKMRVAELIDKHFPTHGHWTGLSLGPHVQGVWLNHANFTPKEGMFLGLEYKLDKSVLVKTAML